MYTILLSHICDTTFLIHALFSLYIPMRSPYYLKNVLIKLVSLYGYV